MNKPLKVCLIGPTCVGKTSLLHAQLDLPLSNDVTVFATYRAFYTPARVKIGVYDTAG